MKPKSGSSARLHGLLAMLRRRRSRTETAVMVLALVGLLSGPCAMAFAAPVATLPAAELLPDGHEQCPNAGTRRVMTKETCCCLLGIAGGAGESSPKPAVPVLMSAPAVMPSLAVLEPVRNVVGPPPRGCRHQTSPPVYLATQRFRI